MKSIYRLFPILILLLAAVLVGCDGSGAPKSQPAPEPEVAVESSSQFLTVSKSPVFISAASPLNPIASLEHPSEVISIDLAPEGLRLISGDRDGNIRIWDLKGLAGSTPDGETPSQTLDQLPCETSRVGWVAGSEMAIGEGLDSTLRLWDVGSSRQLRIFERHSPPPVFALSLTGSSTEYTCHTVLVFENGSWLEARRIGYP